MSGLFSLDVLQMALKSFDLTITPISHPCMQTAKKITQTITNHFHFTHVGEFFLLSSGTSCTKLYNKNMCYAQSTDRDNPRIVLRKPRI